MTPVAKTGLHCGLRHDSGFDPPGDVTPVAKTGLHCGGGDMRHLQVASVV